MNEKFENNIPLPEYPRPQFVRDSFENLNGLWDYAITQSCEIPEKYDGKILVPFSPEAPLSGVNRRLLPHQFLFYRRTFNYDGGLKRAKKLKRDYMQPDLERVQLNFGACDCITTVYINGQTVGEHTGGYLPFSFDITDNIQNGENEIVVKVTDPTETSYHARGKQSLKRGGIWYTAQSGIWQTVWLEFLPPAHIGNIKITPLYDEASVEISVTHNAPSARIDVFFEGEIVVSSKVKYEKNETDNRTDKFLLPLEGFSAWSVDEPNLYDIAVTAGTDRVESYFGMRKIEIKEGSNGYKRVFLNNKEIFLHGVLDQGYFYGGLLTPPTDEALQNDIIIMKKMGFNTLRKHIKIELMRWYYHCDRLGMLVIQDFVNGGGAYQPELNIFKAFFNIKYKDNNERGYKRFGRAEKAGREEFERESEQTVSLLYNSPSIIMWTPFNEAWGQFDATGMAKKIKAWDLTRLIDHASGWYDQGGGDFYSMHIYFTALRKRRTKKRAFLISEYGGLSHNLPDHYFGGKTFGYKRFTDAKKLIAAYEKLQTRLIKLKKRGLCGAIFTQLSDVEDEDNGILTYDRAHIKFDIPKMSGLSEKLYKE